jgi:hypothetical protein
MLAGALGLTACHVTGTFRCELDEQCRIGDTVGLCEINGSCSFEDASCPSGWRYDPMAATADGECTPMLDIAHVAPADEATFTGTDDVTWDGTVVIDTLAMTIDPPLPEGATFRTVTQELGGPELALLEVRRLTSTAMIQVVGTRPLVIAARAEIDFAGDLDVSAHGLFAGPGGSAGGQGPGVGGVGMASAISSLDSGGGGGGFGEVGGGGGSAIYLTDAPPAGAGGASFGDASLTVLVGGSGGGTSSVACKFGGAGGGAVQLTAGLAISMTGSMRAGGGGGEGGGKNGGMPCPTHTSGAGGGAGGAIYLQASRITGTGVLAANGGGGGGGADTSPNADGGPGEDATIDHGGSAGVSTGPTSGAGGVGGSVGAPAATAMVLMVQNGNAGGGGGGVGRIFLDVPDTETIELRASPMYMRR